MEKKADGEEQETAEPKPSWIWSGIRAARERSSQSSGGFLLACAITCERAHFPCWRISIVHIGFHHFSSPRSIHTRAFIGPSPDGAAAQGVGGPPDGSEKGSGNWWPDGGSALNLDKTDFALLGWTGAFCVQKKRFLLTPLAHARPPTLSPGIDRAQHARV